MGSAPPQGRFKYGSSSQLLLASGLNGWLPAHHTSPHDSYAGCCLGSISLRSQMLLWFHWIWFLRKHFMFLLLLSSRSCCFRIQSGQADHSAACCPITAVLLSKVCKGCDLKLPSFVTCFWWGMLVSRKATSLHLNSKVLSYSSHYLVSYLCSSFGILA